MENAMKLLGGSKQILIVGHAATPVPAGYVAYACTIRVDATAIASITELKKKGDTPVANTSETWEAVALLKDDYIKFEYPVISITLTNDADSVWLHLETFVR